MKNQYFIFKLKDQYLPEVVKKCKELKRYFWTEMYEMDKRYFRKLKIQNIEQKISDDEKTLLEFLINTDYTVVLTQLEFEKYGGNNYNNYKTSSTSGYTGVSGSAGVVGVSGVSGTLGTGGTAYSNSTVTWSLPVVTI